MPKRDAPSESLKGQVSRPGKRVKASDQVAQDEDAQIDASWMQNNGLNFRDATVGYVDTFLDVSEVKEYMQVLLNLDDCSLVVGFQPTLKMYDKSFVQSRKVIAYATEPFELKYSGQTMSMITDWPPVLLHCKAKVEAELGCAFNHCMLNRYDDGSVHIGKHRDNAENHIIASVSLGSERDFIMTHDRYSKGRDVDDEGQVMRKRWTLKNGSLFVMTGQTQANWKHEIPKQLKVKQPRISLTFRQMKFT